MDIENDDYKERRKGFQYFREWLSAGLAAAAMGWAGSEYLTSRLDIIFDLVHTQGVTIATCMEGRLNHEREAEMWKRRIEANERSIRQIERSHPIP